MSKRLQAGTKTEGKPAASSRGACSSVELFFMSLRHRIIGPATVCVVSVEALLP
jgi:hypothetical protein